MGSDRAPGCFGTVRRELAELDGITESPRRMTHAASARAHARRVEGTKKVLSALHVASVDQQHGFPQCATHGAQRFIAFPDLISGPNVTSVDAGFFARYCTNSDSSGLKKFAIFVKMWVEGP